MGKISEVEIPPGSGNLYRYEYNQGQTIYRGPVGNAPELKEAEFLAELEMSRESLEIIKDDELPPDWFSTSYPDKQYISYLREMEGRDVSITIKAVRYKNKVAGYTIDVWDEDWKEETKTTIKVDTASSGRAGLTRMQAEKVVKKLIQDYNR
jgi:hypothetical protein